MRNNDDEPGTVCASASHRKYLIKLILFWLEIRSDNNKKNFEFVPERLQGGSIMIKELEQFVPARFTERNIQK